MAGCPEHSCYYSRSPRFKYRNGKQ